MVRSIWIKSVAAALASAGMVLAQQSSSQIIKLGEGRNAQQCELLESIPNADGSCTHVARDLNTGQIVRFVTSATDPLHIAQPDTPANVTPIASTGTTTAVPTNLPANAPAIMQTSAPATEAPRLEVPVQSTWIIVNESGRPSQKARILQAWKDEKGQKAYLAQTADTKELLTIVEMRDVATSGNAHGAISTRFYHWMSDNTPPPGSPIPPPPTTASVLAPRPSVSDGHRIWAPAHQDTAPNGGANGNGATQSQPIAMSSSQNPASPGLAVSTAPTASAPSLPSMPQGRMVVAQAPQPATGAHASADMAVPPTNGSSAPNAAGRQVVPPPDPTAPALVLPPASASEWLNDTTGKPVASGVSLPTPTPLTQGNPVVSTGPNCGGACDCCNNGASGAVQPKPVVGPLRRLLARGEKSNTTETAQSLPAPVPAPSTRPETDMVLPPQEVPPPPAVRANQDSKIATASSAAVQASDHKLPWPKPSATADKGSGSKAEATAKGSAAAQSAVDPLTNPLSYSTPDMDKKIAKSIEGKGSPAAAGSGGTVGAKFEVPPVPGARALGGAAAVEVKAPSAGPPAAQYIAVPPPPGATAQANAKPGAGQPALPPVTPSTAPRTAARTTPQARPSTPNGQPLPPYQMAATETDNAFSRNAPQPQPQAAPVNAFDAGGAGSMPPPGRYPAGPYAMQMQRPMMPMPYGMPYYPPMPAGGYPMQRPMMPQPMVQPAGYYPVQPGMPMYAPVMQAQAPMAMANGGLPGVAQVSSNAGQPYVYDPGLPSAEGMSPAQAIHLLRDALYPSHREWAADQLATADWRTDPQCVTALVQAAAEDPAAGVRAASVRSLGKMNANLVPVVNVLHTLRSDNDPRVQDEVQRALLKLEPNHPADSNVQPAGATMESK